MEAQSTCGVTWSADRHRHTIYARSSPSPLPAGPPPPPPPKPPITLPGVRRSGDAARLGETLPPPPRAPVSLRAHEGSLPGKTCYLRRSPSPWGSQQALQDLPSPLPTPHPHSSHTGCLPAPAHQAQSSPRAFAPAVPSVPLTSFHASGLNSNATSSKKLSLTTAVTSSPLPALTLSGHGFLLTCLSTHRDSFVSACFLPASPTRPALGGWAVGLSRSLLGPWPLARNLAHTLPLDE